MTCKSGQRFPGRLPSACHRARHHRRPPERPSRARPGGIATSMKEVTVTCSISSRCALTRPLGMAMRKRANGCRCASRLRTRRRHALTTIRHRRLAFADLRFRWLALSKAVIRVRGSPAIPRPARAAAAQTVFICRLCRQGASRARCRGCAVRPCRRLLGCARQKASAGDQRSAPRRAAHPMPGTNLVCVWLGKQRTRTISSSARRPAVSPAV